MRKRRLTIATLAVLLLTAAWVRQPTVDLALDAKAIERAPSTAQAEIDLGALGVIALGWTAKRLTQ